MMIFNKQSERKWNKLSEINQVKKWWFMLQWFQYKSDRKNVNTDLNLTNTTIKPVCFMLVKGGGIPKTKIT